MRGSVGVAPGTTTLKLPDGSSVALADWIDDKLYGSVEFANAQNAPVEAFAAGRSQTIPGGTRVQTRVDTNIPRNGDSGLPKDWEMLVYSIGIRCQRVHRTPFTLAAYSNQAMLNTLFGIDRMVSVSLEYNNKSYSTGIISDYPCGCGFQVFSTNGAFEIAQNGMPSPRDRVSLVLPIHFRENLGFKVVFQPESALAIAQTALDAGANLTNADFKVYLYGLVKRTVV